MRQPNNSVKLYIGLFMLFLGGVALFFYLGLSGFCIHIPQIENLIPEEDEPLVLVLCGMGTVVVELAIYCLDTESYAQKLQQANLKRQKMLQEYNAVIVVKDKKTELLLQQLKQLMELKIGNAREWCAVSEINEQREQDLTDKIQHLQSSVNQLVEFGEQLEKRFEAIHLEAESSNKNLAILKSTDVCMLLRKNVKSNMKAERQHMIELEMEIGRLYPRFSNSLYEFFPNLSDRQLDLCLLMKAGFTTVEIATLLCLHYSSVSHMKSRLFKSLNLEGVTDLNDFLTKL